MMLWVLQPQPEELVASTLNADDSAATLKYSEHVKLVNYSTWCWGITRRQGSHHSRGPRPEWIHLGFLRSQIPVNTEPTHPYWSSYKLKNKEEKQGCLWKKRRGCFCSPGCCFGEEVLILSVNSKLKKKKSTKITKTSCEQQTGRINRIVPLPWY